MNRLLRELASVSAGAWELIEAEARRILKEMLVGRKLFNFHGPLGWDASAIEIAFSPRCFMDLTRTTHDGYPVMQHVRRLLSAEAAIPLRYEKVAAAAT